jgi:galactokinase
MRVRAWSTSQSGEGVVQFDLGAIEHAGDWADYLRGIAWVLRDRGVDRGFDMRVESTVPLGSGLSSSASLLVAAARGLRELFALALDDVEIAVLARKAETDFVGAPVGIMDQMACSLADERSALFLDTRTLEFRRVPIPLSAALIVIDSGVRHSHATGGYRVRRDECHRAAEALGVRSLRDVGVGDLPRIASLPAPLDRRARHVVTENARVLAAVDALDARDLSRVGELFVASHASMRDDFEVSVPEVDALVELAVRVQGVYGCRLTGGGFGGSIVALADAAAAAEAGKRIVDAYNAESVTPARLLLPAA